MELILKVHYVNEQSKNTARGPKQVLRGSPNCTLANISSISKESQQNLLSTSIPCLIDAALCQRRFWKYWFDLIWFMGYLKSSFTDLCKHIFTWQTNKSVKYVICGYHMSDVIRKWNQSLPYDW